MANRIKVIRTEEDYNQALELLEKLVLSDPEPHSDEGEQLSLLATLIQDYESKNFPESLPDPVEAILYRMEQQGLKPIDLVPYIGERSRVSEVLSGKRQLTLDMIRKLEAGLGIPAKVLIQRRDDSGTLSYGSWSTRLLNLMAKRGYFGKLTLKEHGKVELLQRFFASVGVESQPAALLRRTSYRTSVLTDKHALSAWYTRIIQQAQKVKVETIYKAGSLDLAYMKDLVKLSCQERSPILAQDRLKEAGVILIVEPHLPKTYLDGAAIMTERENPIIGMSLRHDRLDNFWFTLMHELAHIVLHYDNSDFEIFLDEKVQDRDRMEFSSEQLEREADGLAEESILPREKWEISPAKVTPSAMAAQSLANELGINVAVIAGIIRYKHENYFYLHKLVNDPKSKVRWLFPKVFSDS